VALELPGMLQVTEAGVGDSVNGLLCSQLAV